MASRTECSCGWKSKSKNKATSSRAIISHMDRCSEQSKDKPPPRVKRRRGMVEEGEGEIPGSSVQPLSKALRLSMAETSLDEQINGSNEPLLSSLPPAEVRPQRQSTHIRQFPRNWRDFEATSYTPNTEMRPVDQELFDQRIEPPSTSEPLALSTPNLSSGSPSHSPLNRFRVCHVFAATPLTEHPDDTYTQEPQIPHPHPFKNESIYELLKELHLNPSLKTNEGMNAIATIISSGKLKPEELIGFSAPTELQWLDKFAGESLIAGGPWRTGSVKIKMPCMRSNNPPFSKEADAPDFEVHGIRYRSLTDLLLSKIQDPSTADSFVQTPFTEWWSPPGSATPIRIYGEAYSSDEAVRLFEEVKKIPSPPEHPGIENVVALLSLGSDATHLANFGTASLWPIYVFFGNTSKYANARPSEFTACHLAYIPKLPDSFADAYMKEFGVPPPSDVITHCSRELYHAVARLILEGKFAEAHQNGILIKFPDGIIRRVFPRFYCYIADYPEKVLIANIKNLGQCPCPRCVTRLRDVQHLGKMSDLQRRGEVRQPTRKFFHAVKKARRAIFAGFKVSGSRVEKRIDGLSRVAIDNAFMKCIPGLNVYPLLTVDLLHEVELGVWKALFVHIIRILSAHSPNSVNELDKRFRLISPFGKDKIRKFANNASQMKKLAAHHFEDLLQCMLPVVDGLLPEPHNTTILDLIFTMGCWHAYAKLRIHTELTLTSFEQLTTDLGVLLRQFTIVTCPAFQTMELPRERAARVRRAANGPGSGTGGTRTKVFNMNTYKLHALGDYPSTIRMRGTTDNYTSQRVELEHRTAKAIYPRINKHDTERDIGKLYRRQEVLRYLENTRLPKAPVETHRDYSTEQFKMSEDSRDYVNLTDFTTTPRGASPDLAKHDFVRRLKNYLARWTFVHDPSITSYEDFTDQHRSHIEIESNALYFHKTVEFTYTTYDMQDDKDKIYQRKYQDIMVLSDGEDHPYLYGRVLNLFHVNIKNSGPDSIVEANEVVNVPVIWIRWFKFDTQPQGELGFHTLRYPSISFYSADEADAFGFIHPDEVVRAVHLIPRFRFGHTAEYLSVPSVCRPQAEDEDWKHFSVNILADRDMFMRFRGGGVGHRYMYQVEQLLNSTGWGTAWPSLSERDPIPDMAPDPPCGPNINDSRGDDEGDEDENSESGEVEDGDGEDQEQRDDDDNESDEGETVQVTSGNQVHSKGNGDRESEEEGDELSL